VLVGEGVRGSLLSPVVGGRSYIFSGMRVSAEDRVRVAHRGLACDCCEPRDDVQGDRSKKYLRVRVYPLTCSLPYNMNLTIYFPFYDGIKCSTCSPGAISLR
jgi:hypothetical protein